jgi:hypothetical protein
MFAGSSMCEKDGSSTLRQSCLAQGAELTQLVALGAQVIHARWAMLGALGCVVPELLDQTNHVAWFKAGAEIFSDSGIQYLGVDGLINAKSIVATLIVQVRAGSHGNACEQQALQQCGDGKEYSWRPGRCTPPQACCPCPQPVH